MTHDDASQPNAPETPVRRRRIGRIGYVFGGFVFVFVGGSLLLWFLRKPVAEQALAELSNLAEGKTPYAEDRKLKHRSLAQIKYGKALATYRASSNYFNQALVDAWARAQAGVAASAHDKADLYLAGTHAAQSAAQVVRWVADAAGTSVIYQGQPLERIVRDMETLRHHGFISESRYGSVSQVLWDAALDYQLLLR